MSDFNYISAREHGYDLDRIDVLDHIVLSEHENSLQGEAELRGIMRELTTRFSPDLFTVVYHQKWKLILSSCATNKVLSFHDELMKHIEQCGLICDDDYIELLEEAVCEYWASLEFNERISLCFDNDWPMDFALETEPPPDIRGELEDFVTQ